MSAVGVLAFGDDITDQALYVAVELQDFFEACCLLVCDVLDFALFLYLFKTESLQNRIFCGS